MSDSLDIISSYIDIPSDQLLNNIVFIGGGIVLTLELMIGGIIVSILLAILSVNDLAV